MLYEEYNVIVKEWRLQFDDRKASWLFTVIIDDKSILLVIPLIDLVITSAAEDVILALEELDGRA